MLKVKVVHFVVGFGLHEICRPIPRGIHVVSACIPTRLRNV